MRLFAERAVALKTTLGFDDKNLRTIGELAVKRSCNERPVRDLRSGEFS